MNERRYPHCPECEVVEEMHPWEHEGECGYRCDRCGYTEEWT